MKKFRIFLIHYSAFFAVYSAVIACKYHDNFPFFLLNMLCAMVQSFFLAYWIWGMPIDEQK